MPGCSPGNGGMILHNLGLVLFAPFDVVPAEDVVLQPDVLYLSRERFSLLREECLRGVPDLVVEVLSPNSGRRDRLQKSRLYLRYGVREYWLVDPAAETVECSAPTKRAGYWPECTGRKIPSYPLCSPNLPPPGQKFSASRRG